MSAKYIVYETTNLVNGKFYIGVHKVNNKRNYLGSGTILKLAIKKHGNENFIRKTLKIFTNEQDAYDYEKLIVNENLVNNQNCYNIVEGGGNPPTFYGNDNWMVTNGFKNNHPMQGKHHSISTKDKISKSNKGRLVHNNKKWFINGHLFNSLKDASNFFKCSDWMIRNWCNTNVPNCYSV